MPKLLVNHAKDCSSKMDVIVVVLPRRICFDLDVAGTVHSHKEDFYLITHGPKVRRDVAYEHKAAPSDRCALWSPCS